MCFQYIEICPCCYHATGRQELSRCGTVCTGVKDQKKPVPRERLASFVCAFDDCNLNQATRDRVTATYRDLGQPTLVIGPAGTGKRELDRLAREYGRYPAGTVPDTPTPPQAPKPAPRKRGFPLSVPAGSSGNLGHIKFRQPSRGNAIKEQFRAKGDLHIDAFPPEVQAAIRADHDELNRQIALQMASLDLQAGSKTGVSANWPWIAAEDNLLQNLRCHGFSYSQIAREYITRRTREALIVRRNIQRETAHQRWEGRSFVYRPEGMMPEDASTPVPAQGSAEGPAVKGEQNDQ